MDDKKRDLIPVAAIALFLVIIIALMQPYCAGRHGQRSQRRKARRYGTARNRQSLQNQRRRTQRIRRKKRQERKSRRRKGDSRRMRR